MLLYQISGNLFYDIEWEFRFKYENPFASHTELRISIRRAQKKNILTIQKMSFSNETKSNIYKRSRLTYCARFDFDRNFNILQIQTHFNE